ncbi:hypothetical protein BKA82DRAFT_3930477, partial [Pisolithus tinctorius]
LAKPLFQDAFITFLQCLQLVELAPKGSGMGLGETVMQMSDANWEINTDFEAVFLKLILLLAVKHKVSWEEMIKQVSMFSDMQFDNLHDDSGGDWKTNHDIIEQAYKWAGYDVPEIVYWDLCITVPVTAVREGIAMLSGYSPLLLQASMDTDED